VLALDAGALLAPASGLWSSRLRPEALVKAQAQAQA